MTAFEIWWNNEGSAMRPLPNEDTEEFAARIASIAWSNGAHCALRDACWLQANPNVIVGTQEQLDRFK